LVVPYSVAGTAKPSDIERVGVVVMRGSDLKVRTTTSIAGTPLYEIPSFDGPSDMGRSTLNHAESFRILASPSVGVRHRFLTPAVGCLMRVLNATVTIVRPPFLTALNGLLAVSGVVLPATPTVALPTLRIDSAVGACPEGIKRQRQFTTGANSGRLRRHRDLPFSRNRGACPRLLTQVRGLSVAGIIHHD
jgi:hypothetical protein